MRYLYSLRCNDGKRDREGRIPDRSDVQPDSGGEDRRFQPNRSDDIYSLSAGRSGNFQGRPVEASLSQDEGCA